MTKPTLNHRGDAVVEAASKQDFGWFEERLTLHGCGSLRVQSGYGDASNGSSSWYHVGPEDEDEQEDYDVFEHVTWPTSEQLEGFCNPGVDQAAELTALLNVPVRFSKHVG